jgi:hypothetical protein
MIQPEPKEYDPKGHNNKSIVINEGVMWEENPWKIEFEHECSENGGSPCRHCHSFDVIIHKRTDGSTYSEKVWICNRVIVVRNEGGCNTTGLCLDCVLDVVKDMNK